MYKRQQFIQLLYIFTIIIGAVCFSTQTMVVLKNLDVSNEMVKSKKTTTFFAIILIFNICDFLSVFLDGYVSIQNIEWILIIENVLEVALAYALIAMEAECEMCIRDRYMGGTGDSSSLHQGVHYPAHVHVYAGVVYGSGKRRCHKRLL